MYDRRVGWGKDLNKYPWRLGALCLRSINLNTSRTARLEPQFADQAAGKLAARRAAGTRMDTVPNPHFGNCGPLAAQRSQACRDRN